MSGRLTDRVAEAVSAAGAGAVVKATGRAIKIAQLDPYLPLHELADYSGLSVRTLRDCLTDSTHPLPHYRLSDAKGKILVRVSQFDEWLSAYRQTAGVNARKIAEEMMGRLRGR